MARPGAYRVYLLYSFLTAIFFTMFATYNQVYYVSVIGLNPLQLVLVGTLLEATVFLFEIPTGIVADVYSRRLSIIVGVFLVGLGLTVEGAVPQYWAVMLSQVIWGIGVTFTSGATAAWITDEVGEERVGHVFVRGGQIGTLGGVAGVVVGTALATMAVNLPVLAGGLFYLALGVLLLLIMPEHGFRPTPREERGTFQHMARTFREGIAVVRVRPMLITLLLVGAFWGVASEGYDRLWNKHILDEFVLPPLPGLAPVAWFGLIGILGTPVYLLTSELIRRRVNLRSPRALGRTLLVLNGVIVALMLAFAFATSFPLAVVAVLLIGALRGVNEPLFATWINQHIDSRVRATVLSMASQTDAIGQIAGGPGVGFIGLRLGVRAALTVSALLLTPILVLYARASRAEAHAEDPALP